MGRTLVSSLLPCPKFKGDFAACTEHQGKIHKPLCRMRGSIATVGRLDRVAVVIGVELLTW